MRYDVSLIGDEDLHFFNEGTHLRMFQKMGSHLTTDRDGTAGVAFAVWAPNAEAISVIGDFNGWNRESHPLKARGGSGIWEGFIPALGEGSVYKYRVRSRHNGYEVDKADPFAVRQETPPRTGSWSGIWTTNGGTPHGCRVAGSRTRSRVRFRSTRFTWGPGCGFPKRATVFSPTGKWRPASPTTWSAWALPTSSSCRSRSIRSMDPGDTR